MNKICFDVHAKRNEVQIVLIGDVHRGNEYHAETYFKAVVDYIKQTPNCYFLLNGDLIENNTMNSRGGSVFENAESVATQITMVSKQLAPIVKQGKCICATLGNHEERSSKDVGINPMEMIIANLCKYDETLADRYLPYGAYVFLGMCNATNREKPNKRDSVQFTMYALHGNGGGSISTSVKRLDGLKDIVPANIYCRSHSHNPDVHDGKIMMIDSVHKDILEERCVFVSNGAFLHYGGYAQKGQMEVPSTSTPIITLKCNRRQYKKDGKLHEFYDKEISTFYDFMF